MVAERESCPLLSEVEVAAASASPGICPRPISWAKAGTLPRCVIGLRTRPSWDAPAAVTSSSNFLLPLPLLLPLLPRLAIAADCSCASAVNLGGAGLLGASVFSGEGDALASSLAPVVEKVGRPRIVAQAEDKDVRSQLPFAAVIDDRLPASSPPAPSLTF